MRYAPLPGNGPEITVANALRELAKRSDQNSARQISKRMPTSEYSIGHETVGRVLSGKSSVINPQNVVAVAESIAQGISSLDQEGRDMEVKTIKDLHGRVFRPPRTWDKDITRHCSNVAFDWASSLPGGQRRALEVIATVAMRELGPALLRTEVFDPNLDHEINYNVMQGSRVRTIRGGSWDDMREDGPTWRAMWGPVGPNGKKTDWFIVVYLDALGAVSVYVRASPPRDKADLVADAALITALQIVRKIGWIGTASVLVESAEPSLQARRNHEAARDAVKHINVSPTPGIGWTTHVNKMSVTLPSGSEEFNSTNISRKLIYGLDWANPANAQTLRTLDQRADDLSI